MITEGSGCTHVSETGIVRVLLCERIVNKCYIFIYFLTICTVNMKAMYEHFKGTIELETASEKGKQKLVLIFHDGLHVH